MNTLFDDLDDQTTVNARIAEQEVRLGLPKSGPHDDIAKSNMILRGLQLLDTPAKPTAPAVQPTPAPARSASTVPDVGHPRVAQGYRPQQHARPNDVPSFPNDGKLHGVSLLAAYYAKHA